MKVKYWIIAVAICIAAVFVSVFLLLSMRYEGQESVRIYVPHGFSDVQLRDSLSVKLGERDGAWVYRFWSWCNDDVALSNGSYVIDPGENLFKAGRRIAKGVQTPLNVTLHNMRTLNDLAKRLAAKLEYSEADYIDAIDSVLGNTYNKKADYAAAFLPDTYNFFWNEDPQRVISRLVEVRDGFWNEERQSKAEKMGLTPIEVATVASIVEEESNKADERPLIARLYLNRLHKGMKLQADPTVKFAVGDFTLRRITGRHLKIDSPYNTYMYSGLPLGPIRIVERSTIDAVLNAPIHDYLYMCAKEDFSGYHNFASDYAEHQRNAKRYQTELNRRGIR